MVFDYRKLRGRIVEKYGSQRNFSKAIGMSERTLTLKMNNSRCWRQTDINKAAKLLEISPQEISLYFFTPEVQNIEHKEVT